jgi:SAM-dependent methyltransferase
MSVPVLSVEEVWRRYDETEARLTAPLSERMLDLAGLRPGMRVLDLAAGRGEPSLRAARRVGPSGSVLGVDLSDPLLQMAREKAAQEGLTNLELRAGDAQSLDVHSFHCVTARWGLMYMASPVDALTRARAALLPTGVLVAALWAEPDRVPYFTLPRRLLERYRAVPPIDFEVPGTFRFADPERITHDFAQAGFIIEHLEEMDLPVMEAQTSAELIAWVRAFGLTRLLNELPEADQQAWERDLAAEGEGLRQGGLIQLGGVTRIVVARPLAP